MSNIQKRNFDKRQIINLSLMIVSTLLFLVLIIWYFFKDFGPNDKNLSNNENTKNKEQLENFEETNTNIIEPKSLSGNYVGLRESIDGSIEAVLFQIKTVNEIDYTFDYVLNIGTSQKFSGIGKIEPNKSHLQSDMIGDMNYSLDTNGNIVLISDIIGSKATYKLMREKE